MTLKSFKRQPGFTLIELLVTMVVAGIVLTLGIPSALTMMRNNQLVSKANDFLNTVHFARSEAIKRGLNVGMCSSVSFTACDGSDEWQNGWIAWVDSDQDGTKDAGEEIVYIFENDSTNLSMINVEGLDRIIYLANGYLSIPPATSVHFKLCDDRVGEAGRNIKIVSTGSPKTELLSCG